MFKGKQVVALGERDGIAGPAIVKCSVSPGGSVVFSSTECFV